MDTKQEIIYHKSELHWIGQHLLKGVKSPKVAFYGEVGAGKTTLIKQLAQALGVTSGLSSPTFSLVNEYHGPGLLVHHLDLYRLRTIEEALEIGIEDYLYDEFFTFVEWPELIEPILPDNTLRLRLEILDQEHRKLVYL